MLRFTFPYLFFVSLTAFAGGILNTYGRFAVPAFTPVILNIVLITGAIWLAPLLDEPGMALAYAVTIHKSQGSEYPAVVIPVLPQHYILLQRNLIYTAVTRGKRLVVIVGSKKALAMGINNNKTERRHTYLRYRLN